MQYKIPPKNVDIKIDDVFGLMIGEIVET